MMRGRDKRLGRLRTAIDAAPVLPHVLDEAYAVFNAFGELPDEDHVADTVMQRALRGGDDEGCGRNHSRVRITVATSAHEHLPTVREPLFEEALDDFDCRPRIARPATVMNRFVVGEYEGSTFQAIAAIFAPEPLLHARKSKCKARFHGRRLGQRERTA